MADENGNRNCVNCKNCKNCKNCRDCTGELNLLTLLLSFIKDEVVTSFSRERARLDQVLYGGRFLESWFADDDNIVKDVTTAPTVLSARTARTAPIAGAAQIATIAPTAVTARIVTIAPT
ncbi:hypothetical protein PG995_010958 [Apiospora arundinis]